MLKKFKKNLESKKEIIFLIFFLSPVLVINIHHYHDWGGDYAQYLNQTKELFSPNSQPDIINGNEVASKQRGAGFSLLLALPYLILGHNIKGFLFLISICLFTLGIVLFQFFKIETQNSRSIISILMALAFVFNYHVQNLKLEIMPEFPFMLAVYGSFLISDFNKNSNLIFLGILVGLAITFKNLGWVLFLAILVLFLFKQFNTNKKKYFQGLFSLIFIPILINLTVHLIIYRNISGESLWWYNKFFSNSISIEQIAYSFPVYFRALTKFFEQEVWGWANALLKTGAICFTLIGLFFKWKKGFQILDLFFALYVIVLLIYPYQNEPYRFLIPIFPIVLLYLFWGLKQIDFQWLSSPFISIVIAGILLSNTVNLKNLFTKQFKELIGPEHILSKQAFKELENILSNNEAVGCTKPWVIHYYTETSAYFLKDSTFLKTDASNPKYVLVAKHSNVGEVYDESLKNSLTQSAFHHLIWENDAFYIYKKN